MPAAALRGADRPRARPPRARGGPRARAASTCPAARRAATRATCARLAADLEGRRRPHRPPPGHAGRAERLQGRAARGRPRRRRRDVHRGAAWARSAPASSSPTSRCACWPTATSSRRRCTSIARPRPRARAASSPTSATSRSATSSSTRTTASAASRAWRRSRWAGIRREFMVLVYQGGDKLKVPGRELRPRAEVRERGRGPPARRQAGQRHLGEDQAPGQEGHARHGGGAAASSTRERKARPGHAFTGESPWQREFEESFEYEETPDQAAAIADVMRDMSEESPMDRLICGDVGYGKTEVAMRAAMRAVLDAQAGGGADPHHHPRLPALEDLPQALRALPGEGGDGLALPHRRRRSSRSSRDTADGQGGHPHRHPPPAQQGRGLPRPRPPRHRRGAALRGGGQGEAQAAAHARWTASPCPPPPSRARCRWAWPASATCRSSRPRPRTAWPSRPRS